MLSYEEKFKIMNEYLVKNNGLKTGIKSRMKYGEYPIGQWQANMRKQYYRGELKLTPELENKFLEIGVLIPEKERKTAERLTWDKKFDIMNECLKSGQVICSDTVYNGYNVGQWQAVIRHLFYTSKLKSISPELKKKFFEAGILRREKGRHIKKGSAKISYDKKFDIMYRYLEKTGFEEEIHQDTVFEGHRIEVWQDNLRQTYRKGRDLLISTELMEKLFSYGILREEDRNKRNARVTAQGRKTSKSSEDEEVQQMVQTLLRKQEERKALDLEIAELQEKISAKKDREI